MLFRNFRHRSWGWRQRFGHWSGSLLCLHVLFFEQFLSVGSIYTIRLPNVRNRITLRAKTSDYKVLEQVFLTDALSFTLIASPKTIIDAGANIGLVAVALAERYPMAKIVSLEVDDGNFSLLEHNTRRYSNCTCLKVGLWSHKTILQIENPDDPPWAFRVVESTDGNGTINAVGITDLMKFLETENIDLLKIDIEGSELEVFSSNVISWIDKVDCIAIELHDRFRPGCRTALEIAVANKKFTWISLGEYQFLTKTH